MKDFEKNFPDHRIITLSRDSHLTQEMVEDLDKILDYASLHELRDCLIEIYHHYLIHKHDSLPGNFKRLAETLYILIDFLNQPSSVKG